jgi:hypothetical protein
MSSTEAVAGPLLVVSLPLGRLRDMSARLAFGKGSCYCIQPARSPLASRVKRLYLPSIMRFSAMPPNQNEGNVEPGWWTLVLLRYCGHVSLTLTSAASTPPAVATEVSKITSCDIAVAGHGQPCI